MVLTSETNGCDSTVTSNVIFQPNYDMSVALDACDDGSYLFPDGTLPPLPACSILTCRLPLDATAA